MEYVADDHPRTVVKLIASSAVISVAPLLCERPHREDRPPRVVAASAASSRMPQARRGASGRRPPHEHPVAGVLQAPHPHLRLHLGGVARASPS
jgi:hypothetical protein